MARDGQSIAVGPRGLSRHTFMRRGNPESANATNMASDPQQRNERKEVRTHIRRGERFLRPLLVNRASAVTGYEPL